MQNLSELEIEENLQELKNWEYAEDAIHLTLEFENFKAAFSFMTLVAFEAEAQQHHPNWINVYNTLNISLSTHDTGGVTKKDIQLAKTIDALVGSNS